MAKSAWVLEIAWIAWADFACQMKISCHIDRDLFVTSFLGVENCSPANVVVALVDFTQGVSFTLKHLRWFLKQNVWFPHLDMFSNMQAMCVARTHSCMGESLWATHSFWWKIVEKCSSIFLLMDCFCTCCEGTFVLLPKAVLIGIWLFFFYSLFCEIWRTGDCWKVWKIFNFFQKAKFLEARACVDWRSLIAWLVWRIFLRDRC